MAIFPCGSAIQPAAAGAGGGFYDYPINQSLRLNDNDSAYLSRTFASAGTRTTWTWSGWVKRGNLTGTDQTIFSANATYNDYLFFGSDNTINWYASSSSAYYGLFKTNALFRDTSAWYHIVWVRDTNNATAADRSRLYVNGERATLSSSGTIPSGFEGRINEAISHEIGVLLSSQYHYDGYMAEVHFIDGQALDPTDFGEEISGVWKPIAYAGSYGTNGFYLDFADSADIGSDESGNGNDWTINSLAATDVVLDSPTNNFCVMNPLNKNSGITYTEGNLEVRTSSGNAYSCYSTFAMKNDGASKHYFEVMLNNSGASYKTYLRIGLVETHESPDQRIIQDSDGSFLIRFDGFYNSSGTKVYSFTASLNDIYGFGIDFANNQVLFYVNGTLAYTYTSAFGTNKEYYAALGDASSSGVVLMNTNFGQDSSFAGNKTAQGNTDDNGYGDFYYAPPTGYLALCTANIQNDMPASIDPLEGGSPQDHFSTVLHSGNSSTQAITGVGFQPDWVWSKERNIARSHNIFDAVRGTLKTLSSDTTGAEVNLTNSLTSFDSDGFTLGSDGAVNYTGRTYANWCWKANGTGVTNTDGTITSTVSANTDAGFSIVSWTADGSANGQLGHGLSETPEIIFYKARSSTSGFNDWWTLTTAVDGSLDYLRLNSTDAAGNQSTTSISSSTITNWGFPSSTSMIAYCFHSVEGFSKFGSYTGNGSTDGSFIYTGFRPAFVIVKRTNTTGNWILEDATRSPENVVNKALFPNASYAESTQGSTNSIMDMLSNGFKLRGTGGDSNASGATYIYMAFAENPFKYANAR